MVLILLLGGHLHPPNPNPSSGSSRPPQPRLMTSSHSPMPAGCGANGTGCSEELLDANGQWKLQVFRNLPLSGSATPTGAVIVIHGTGRNAAGYFAGMVAAAEKAGTAERTIVIAPWFKTAQDHPAQGEAYWVNDTWKDGENAVSPPTLSSFQVIDQLMATLADPARFPHLRHITLAGHSAGGQFTQRYAALGLAPNSLSRVTVNYVPANPSTYLYFGPTRPASTGTGFAIPTPAACPDWDDYKYGMVGRSGYVAQLTPRQAFTNYIQRRVIIINGGADTVNNGDMDTSCGAMAEGPNREARGATFSRLIHTLAPAAAHARVIVPGVAHDADAIWASARVWPVLFGSNDSAGAATEAASSPAGTANPS